MNSDFFFGPAAILMLECVGQFRRPNEIICWFISRLNRAPEFDFFNWSK